MRHFRRARVLVIHRRQVRVCHLRQCCRWLEKFAVAILKARFPASVG